MTLQYIYDFPEDAPNYPSDFYEIQGGTKKLKVKNKFLLVELNAIEEGEWRKVYSGFQNYRPSLILAWQGFEAAVLSL